jgi:cytochrome c oxidase cbb3-type subunit 2
MPAYPWLAESELDPEGITRKMNVLRMLGHPYTDEQIAAAPAMLEGKNELDAVIAYLQVLGTAGRGVQ